MHAERGNDIQKLGWNIQKYDADSAEELTGGYFIAMALIPMEGEYHFYRQDKMGLGHASEVQVRSNQG